jgi:serine/threonine-protein kinase
VIRGDVHSDGEIEILFAREICCCHNIELDFCVVLSVRTYHGVVRVSADSSTLLVKEIQRLGLLEPLQQAELTECLQRRYPDIRDLARELARREWVTPFQLQRVCQGRGRELLIGPYLLLDLLNNGAIGPLFKARHERTKNLVSIQIVREVWLAGPNAVARFHKDMQAAGKLIHLHIARVLEVARMGRVRYVVLEPLEGLDLDRIVDEFGPLPVERACSYIRQAALGLQHAFTQGLWHHDLKPSLLFVTRQPGQFGPLTFADVANTRIDADASCDTLLKIRNLGLTSLQLTASGAGPAHAEGEDTIAVKTEDCNAPEQKLGAYPADVRANLYSLGCTLYYLLTGRVPFPGGDAREKQARHRTEEPIPVERLRPETTPRVAAVLRRLMAKDPEGRYQTPAEAADALAITLGTADNATLDDLDFGAHSAMVETKHPQADHPPGGVV